MGQIVDDAMKAAAEEAKANEPLPSLSELESLSIASLRKLIERAGLQTSDCLEKSDIRSRALQALVKLGGATEEELKAYLAKRANPPAAAEEEEEVCSVQAQHSTQ